MYTLKELHQIFEKSLQNQKFPSEPSGLYEPCNYILSLSGKRLRPIMALMACNLFKNRVTVALPVAYAVEVFHNFTLMHDDIMDAAPLRRGQPTVHAKYDLNTGILSGDVMLVKAYEALEKIRDKKSALQIYRTFTRVAVGVCEGQQYDVDFETQDDVSLDAYTKMIELKTAVLLGGALEMGALAAKAPEEEAQKLYQFGRLAGIAFQIQDDLLDAFGDPATFGKQVGGDILQNKKTFLVLKTKEVAPKADFDLLQAWFEKNDADPTEKIEAVKAIFIKNKIPQLVEAEKERYAAAAMLELDSLMVDPIRKVELRKVVSELLYRNK